VSGLLDGLDNFDDLDDYPSIEEGSEYDADENLQDVEYDPEDLEEQDEGSGDEAEFGDEDDKSDVPEMEREWGGISSGEVEENVAQTNAEDEVTQLIPGMSDVGCCYARLIRRSFYGTLCTSRIAEPRRCSCRLGRGR
jgi:hypothetical protein